MAHIPTTISPPSAIILPPFNSSGDATHIASLVAAVRGLGKTPPCVYLGVTCKGQYCAHSLRSYQLLVATGATAYPLLTSPTCYRPKYLVAMTRLAAFAHDATIVACDQKSTTWLLNRLVATYGRQLIVNHIRATLVPSSPPSYLTQWASRQITGILSQTSNNNKIAIHIARSGGSQPQHNLCSVELNKIDQALAAHAAPTGVVTITLAPVSYNPSSNQPQLTMFPPAGTVNDRIGFHYLLDQLQQRLGSKLLTTFGATSGILDAAAFLGLPTISVHKFTKNGRNEQDQREKLMHHFKSVADKSNLLKSFQQALASPTHSSKSNRGPYRLQNSFRDLRQSSGQRALMVPVGPTW